MIPMTVTNRIRMRTFRPDLTFLLALAIGAVLSLGGGTTRARGDHAKAPAEALKPLQGTWVPVEDQGIDSKWTFEGEILKASVNGMDYTCKVKIDSNAKPHASLDFLIDEGPEDSKGKTSKCIYKLDGEKLTLCVSIPGKDRPKAFEQAEDEHYVFELKKEKKSEEKKGEEKKGGEKKEKSN
jgi:uncharacterized protein (TIGR03067 family)